MSWAWSGFGVLGTTLALLYAVLAVVVYAVGPRRTINRWLSLFLFLNAANVGAGGGLMYLATDYETSYAFQITAYAGGIASLMCYVAFVARAIPSPLVTWARSPIALAVLGVVTLAAEVTLFARTDLFSKGLYRASYGTWENQGGPLANSMFLAMGVVSLFGLVAAATTWLRAARGTELRRKAALYAVAFLFQDLPVAVYSFIFIFLADSPLRTALGFAVYAVFFAFPPLLTYALLRGQLFDIDIRLKITLRRSVVVSSFVVVFLLVSQILENVVDARLGYIAGGIATTLLLLALNPLQKFAERLSNVAMPKVEDTELYRGYRKLEVYRDAFEAFLMDGRVSKRERLALERLRTKLGLSWGIVERLEADHGVPTPAGGPPGSPA
jgi:hypothetical protein